MNNLLILFLAMHLYVVTLQNKGGVRTKTTIEAETQHKAKQLAKTMYKDQKVISVVLKK
jgi:hypothetical protein